MRANRTIAPLIATAVVGLASTVAALCGESEATPTFTDIAGGQGIDLTSLLTESLAWGDYDNDGDEDLYLTNDGPNNLFRNEGGGLFTDVTATAGVGDGAWSVGAAFGDLNNDGYLDLYVVSFGGTDTDVLYRNDGPTGPGGAFVFTDVTTTAGVTNTTSSRGVALLDYDRDGGVSARGRELPLRDVRR